MPHPTEAVHALEDFIRRALETAERLREAKRSAYSSAADPLSNYRMAAVVAGIRPEQYLLGRVAEKIARAGIAARVPGEACQDVLREEALDIVNCMLMAAWASTPEAA